MSWTGLGLWWLLQSTAAKRSTWGCAVPRLVWVLRHFPPVSLKRAVTHCKHGRGTSHCGLQTCWLTINMPGHQQTTVATSAERCSALQGLSARKCFVRAWDCGGIHNLWLQTAPPEAVQFQGFCDCSVSSLQSLLSEPVPIGKMMIARARVGSKHASSPQTCQAASQPWPLPTLSAALRFKDYAKNCSELAWDYGGFCNL